MTMVSTQIHYAPKSIEMTLSKGQNTDRAIHKTETLTRKQLVK